MKTTANEQARESDREIVVVRTIDAPRSLVWQAWTDPERIGAWWGPHGFTTTTHHFELTPGGSWRFVMHGPDGTDFRNHIVFREVSEPTRLVYDQDNDAAEGDEEEIRFQTTVSFEAQDEDRTKVTLHTVFELAEVRDRVSQEFGAVEGGVECLGRLAQHVFASTNGNARHREVMTMTLPNSREIALYRRFDAPPSLVFDMFTKAEHLCNWWGCGHFEIETCEVDLRVGGKWQIVMRATDGKAYPSFGTYLEIEKPHRLVQTVHLFREDDESNPPIETFELQEQDKGKATLLINSVRYPTKADRDRHLQNAIDQGAAEAYEMINNLLIQEDPTQ